MVEPNSKQLISIDDGRGQHEIGVELKIGFLCVSWKFSFDDSKKEARREKRDFPAKRNQHGWLGGNVTK
jgi:hypothetical protein